MISFILLSFIDIAKYFPELNFDNILTLAYNATNLCNNGNFCNPQKDIRVFRTQNLQKALRTMQTREKKHEYP